MVEGDENQVMVQSPWMMTEWSQADSDGLFSTFYKALHFFGASVPGAVSYLCSFRDLGH